MIIRPKRRRRPPITDQFPFPPPVRPPASPYMPMHGGLPSSPPGFHQISAGHNGPPQNGGLPGGSNHGGPHNNGGGGGGHNGPPGQVNIPGFTPDYQSLIENDPYFAQIRDMISAQSQAEGAQNTSQLGQAFINFGETPEGYDPTVAGAASNNPFSTLAQLNQAHEQNLRSSRNELASRGILQSGEYGHQLGNENRDYGQAQFEARQGLLDYINGVQAAFAQHENERNRQLIDAGQQAYQNQLALPQNTPTSGFNANLGSSWHGGAYYKGKDGKLYGQNGQPVDIHQEAQQIRQRIQAWKNQGRSQNWIRNTPAWQSLQYLLGFRSPGAGGGNNVNRGYGQPHPGDGTRNPL